MLLCRDIRGLTFFLKTIVLPRTPDEVLIYTLIILVLYYGQTSFEVALRVNDIVFPFFVAGIVLVPILISNEFTVNVMFPILTESATDLLASNFIALSAYGDILVIGAFMHMLTSPQQVHTGLRYGVLISGISLTLFMFLIVSVLGTHLGPRALFPSYTMIQQIHLTDFMDRVEVALFSVWLPAFMIKIVAIYLAMLNGLSSFFKKNQYQLFNKSLSWLMFLTVLMGIKTVIELQTFSAFVNTFITLLLVFPFLVLLLLFAKRKKKPKSSPKMTVQPHSSDPSQADVTLGTTPSQGGAIKGDTQSKNVPQIRASAVETNTEQRNDPEPKKPMHKQSWIKNQSYSDCIRIGNLLIFGCVVVIVIGTMAGTTSPLIGNWCGVLFVTFLLGAFVIGHYEIEKLTEMNTPHSENKVPGINASN
jgi:spore germination protein (amino acid permease)